MLTIWGRLSSINVQKVVWAAGEVGQPFERIDVGGPFGGLDTPEFAAMNPNRQIPVLRDGELVLWESSSILRYIAARYASGVLWEEDPARRVLADRWVDWMQSELQPALTPVLWGLVRKAPAFADPKVIAEAVGRAEALMAILEVQLADRPFLAGERFGMADIAVGCGAHRWLNMPVERTARPAAQAALPLPIT